MPHRTINFYMEHQEACSLRAQVRDVLCQDTSSVTRVMAGCAQLDVEACCSLQAGSPAGSSARVPWLDYRASPPDERIPPGVDVFAGAAELLGRSCASTMARLAG